MEGTTRELAAALAERYRIERQIGQGGMATVYLARDLKHDREVALKVLRPELGALLGTERFLAEVKITARLDHPHILTLIDSGSAGGLLYYVLPFVRGESLRDLLDREHQLSVEQALAITRQVGSALEYAHRHGVVHRDIKPENVLLQEGEAMLADFGIALAVRESGGKRLTETGLSLGTPHYMSPEQATGDRNLDARSDQYSLAAMLYEMLVGEPPLTGKTVQAIVAKLLTEVPMRIRVVRKSVPEHVDDAVARALSKVPADRFASVAEFMQTLDGELHARHPARAAPATFKPWRSRGPLVAGALAGVALVGVAATLMMSKREPRPHVPVTLRDRSQLTFTGRVQSPAISLDGKQLAFFTKACTGADCRYAIDLQDVGSTTTRRVLEGATSAYGLEWSPDRRNLIMFGTIAGRMGSYLVPVLGGSPRFLNVAMATFYGGGDSVLLGRADPSGSSFVVRVAGVDGAVRDSLRVPGTGEALSTLISIPGTTRFGMAILRQGRGLWQLVDRRGVVTDTLTNSCACGGTASADALWMLRSGVSGIEAVVRVGVDVANGTFAERQDTVYTGLMTGLSVTADGTQLVVDDGSYMHSVVVGELSELLQGKLPPGAPRMEASRFVRAQVSPDGKRLFLRRAVPGPDNLDAFRFSVSSFDGDGEVPLSTVGRVLGAGWVDSTTVFTGSVARSKARFARTDVRTGAVSQVLELPDSVFFGLNPLPDGWAWIPKGLDRVIVERGGKRHEIPKPSQFQLILGIGASLDGSRLLMSGANWTEKNYGIAVVPTAGGTPVSWFQGFAEDVWATWLADGSIALAIWSSSDAATLHKLSGPGRDTNLGTIKHVVSSISVSSDLKRAAIGWREYRGDAWSHRVVKP